MPIVDPHVLDIWVYLDCSQSCLRFELESVGGAWSKVAPNPMHIYVVRLHLRFG